MTTKTIELSAWKVSRNEYTGPQHVMQVGETLAQVAEKYDTSLDSLAERNRHIQHFLTGMPLVGVKVNLPLSWTPRRYDTDKNGRRGDFYCSPACGGANLGVCTWAEYQRCVTASEILASAMGEGWTTRIHENLGWFWCIYSPDGRLEVSPDYSYLGGRPPKLTGYTAGILTEPFGIGYRPGWYAHAKTPQEAISKALAQARAEVTKLAGMVEGL